jgi:hypothetical protein
MFWASRYVVSEHTLLSYGIGEHGQDSFTILFLRLQKEVLSELWRTQIEKQIAPYGQISRQVIELVPVLTGQETNQIEYATDTS